MQELFSNNAITALNGAINSAVTTIVVDDASSFPQTPGQFRISIQNELMLVTYVSGNTWTVQRGIENTTPASHGDGQVVKLILTNESIQGLIRGKVAEEHQGIYLMSCHKSTNERAYLLSSPNGKRWNTLNPRHFFNPITGNQRDVSITNFNGQYLVAHTNSTNTFWTLLKSIDLLDWEHVADVDMTSIASLHRVWAPEFFIDDDGTLRVFTSCSTGGVLTNFQIYEQHLDDPDDLTDWTNPVLLTGTSLRTNMIDAYCVRKAGFYHIWYKDDTTKFVEIMRSASLLTGYTIYKGTDWAGWGSGLEGPTLVKINEDTWRIWLNENSGFDSVAVYYSDSSSDDWGTATWSSKVAINTPWVVAHPTILFVKDFPTIRNMFALFQEKSRPLGAELVITVAQSIPDITTTPLDWDAATYDDIPFWDNATKLVVNAPGYYMISARVVWAANTTGRRTLDILINGTTIRGGVSQGVGASNFTQATCISQFLTEDDYVEATVFQNSTVALNVASAQMQIVRLF